MPQDPRHPRRVPQIGPYRVLEQIGAGAMGAVYLVERSGSGERYALKLIRPDLFAGEQDLARFRREAELVARLNHPHVVRLRDVSFTTSAPYQVYDLFEGGTLQGRLQREGRLPLGEALELIRKLGEGLAHAHDQGVLHRDLKPENVLLDLSGEPALADFGLARQDQAQSRGLTATGETVGTPLYMAPEQAIDSKRVDARADVYGLAAICYALLSGGPPVVGTKTVLEAFDKVLNEPPPPLKRADVPPAIEEAVLRGLAKDPSERPPTVAAFLASLEDPPQALGSRVPRFVAGASALALVAIAGLVWELTSTAPPPVAAGPTSSSTRSLSRSPQPSPSLSTLPRASEAPVGPANLRPLAPDGASWGWLTVTPAGAEQGVGLSLLMACRVQGDALRVRSYRGRGLEGDRVWDTLWASGEGRLKGVIGPTLLAEFDVHSGRANDVVVRAGSPRPGPGLEGLRGVLRESLEPSGLATIFRLLARKEPGEAGLRVATRGGHTYSWEPLVWAGSFEWPEAERLILNARPLRSLRGQLARRGVRRGHLKSAFTKLAWAGMLTHNRSRDPDQPFPTGWRCPLAIPRAPEDMADKPKGSLRLAARTAVFAQPEGLLLGLSSSQPTRYLVFGDRGAWIRIGWGGGRGWVRGSTSDSAPGRWARTQADAVSIRVSSYYPAGPEDPRGPNPRIGTLPPGACFAFTGRLGGPTHEDPRISKRWAEIQFDDRRGWAACWHHPSVKPGAPARRVVLLTFDE